MFLKVQVTPFKLSDMPKRNAPNDIQSLHDLNDLENIVHDKRNHKRKDEKKHRRDRHYNKLFIKIAIKNHLDDAGID